VALPPPTHDQGEPHPLGGRRPFRVGVIGCLASMVIGGVVTLLAEGDFQGAGIALLVLGAFAFVTLTILRVLETMTLRHRDRAQSRGSQLPPIGSNGHGQPPRFRSRQRP
jgi:hypothetical protein